ncbi:hypothetical protein [Bradyrhizobium sp. STM 3843]|uniref:outer membrane protein n=1 Tax=Bradyrhizobium sp. STM 3843 TaxID=551947 RepID=UPI000563EF87|nr:hypothetical protein [Bradyrhizobium sp. STM 3843]
MSNFAGRLSLALVLTALSLGGPVAHAQTAPIQYWVAGWPVDVGSGGQGLDSYGNFPSFDGSGRDSGFFTRRYSFSTDWSALGGVGLNPQLVNRYGSLGSLSVDGTQFGYKINSGVSLFGGFDTLKYDSGTGGPFAAFDSRSSATAGYRAHAGVAFQPAPNVSLSLGFSYTQQGSDRLDSDISSQALPGETPSAFTSGRR